MNLAAVCKNIEFL